MRSDDKRKEFIDDVLSHVRFKYDHWDIKKELEEHMEDMCENMISDGISEEDAQRLAVEFMGDAKEIGEALDKEHSPVIGWIWRVLRIIALVLAISCVGPALNMGLGAVFSIFSSYGDLPENKEVLYDTEVDKKVRIDDNYIKIDRVILYDDDSLEIRYKTWYRPFSDSVRWTSSLSTGYITDDLGTEYHGSSGSSSAGIVNKSRIVIKEFNPKAEELIIDYDYNGRKFYVSIPLERQGGDN